MGGLVCGESTNVINEDEENKKNEKNNSARKY